MGSMNNLSFFYLWSQIIAQEGLFIFIQTPEGVTPQSHWKLREQASHNKDTIQYQVNAGGQHTIDNHHCVSGRLAAAGSRPMYAGRDSSAGKSLDYKCSCHPAVRILGVGGGWRRESGPSRGWDGGSLPPNLKHPKLASCILQIAGIVSMRPINGSGA